MNRLARERSPYLLQHAANPVDWFPWGDEAFAKARAEDKPIFLSVGYSTCHWCHVMEHESFEQDEVASVLNANFVSIKVDREERPDVDRVYMAFVQATTQSGGWPMSVWLTPDLEPFYGGTYFPPTSRWGRPGFVEILHEIAHVWQTERARVVQSAEALTSRLRALESGAPTWTVPGRDALSRTVRQFRDAFDPRFGGFGDAPKFPRPSELLFLLREYARTGERDLCEMVLRSLRAMALGGMRDHVGGGFHRYAVDAAWRVPHFEKMLYDQAQLVLALLEAAQASAEPFYADVARDTLDYVLRDMQDEQGGFWSAEDADSEGREGAFYLWTADEIDALLGTRGGDADGDADVVKLRFGIEPNGNAPQDPQQEFAGKNLLYVARSVDDIAPRTGKSPAQVTAILDRARGKMFEARLARPRPHLDDKILTSWNGLMIAALARAARVLGSDRCLAAARRAASFVRGRMWNADSRTLLRRYRADQAEISGYAEDYAYLIFGLLELVQADADPGWLEWAIALQHRQDELFWDDEAGGWFSTDGRDASVLLRMKEDYDGAEPTASSISVLNLLTLSHLVHQPPWTDRIERTLRLFGARLEGSGRAVPMMAAALSTYTAGIRQIVVARADHAAADPAASAAPGLAEAIASRYLPFAVTLSVDDVRRRALAGTLPFIAEMTPVAGRTAAYVCYDYACRQPVTTMEAFEQELGTTPP
jgi:uncharacterized protein YyaL (SSP411 family)